MNRTDREEIKAIVRAIAGASRDDAIRLHACEVWLQHDDKAEQPLPVAQPIEANNDAVMNYNPPKPIRKRVRKAKTNA